VSKQLATVILKFTFAMVRMRDFFGIIAVCLLCVAYSAKH